MKYLSLFSGIGGLEFGLHKAGHECIGISEIKESSVEIYQKNMGPVKNFGDITKIEPKNLPNFDLLIGGFPCQTFSMAGARRGFKDRKGKMIFYIYDIIKEKKPKFIVLENVKGIISHNGGKTIKNVVQLLQEAGYYCRILLRNAIFYGSAQNRERVIFLAAKTDFKRKIPVIKDVTKLFKDIRTKGPFKTVTRTDFNVQKIEQKRQFNFELIGDYDRVGTLTTQSGCGEKLVWESSLKDFRYLTPIECERLQGFPDNWTKGISDNNRYFALGNAVNCYMSDYLFNDYLKGVWY